MVLEAQTMAALALKYGLQNVYLSRSVNVDGVTFPAEPLTSDEMNIWTLEFDTIIAPVVYQKQKKRLLNGDIIDIVTDEVPTGNVSSILRAKAMHLYLGCMIAKRSLEETFTGYYAKPGEIGWRHIKPCDVIRSTDATETPVDSWEVTLTANSDNWMGYGAANATKIDVDKNACVCGVGIGTDSVNFKVEQLKFTIGTQEMNPILLQPTMDMSDAIQGKRVMPMKTLMLKPRAIVLGESYSAGAWTGKLMVFGVTYADGKYLNEFTRTSVEL